MPSFKQTGKKIKLGCLKGAFFMSKRSYTLEYKGSILNVSVSTQFFAKINARKHPILFYLNSQKNK